MKTSTASLYMLLVLTPVYIAQAQVQYKPQSSLTPTCEGRIYTSRDLLSGQKARITSRRVPIIPTQALQNNVHGRVVLEAVLCRNGQVTDVQVIEGLPHGMTEAAIQSALGTTFTPAEMNWHTVSQKMRFEYSLNETGSLIANADAAGRMLETIEVVGNRRLEASKILQHLESKLGDPYDEKKVQRDLAAILSTGYFNPGGTRAYTEAKASGGIVLVFEVMELPLIVELRFEGLKEIPETVMVDALLKEHIDLRKGTVHSIEKEKSAVQIIKKVLDSNGQKNARVEVRGEEVSATNVVLTFVISRK